MATLRKRWFRVADAVGAKPVSNDALAFFMRLSAHMNSRWARDGLTPEQACECTLTTGQLAHIAGVDGRKSYANATRILREWCANWDGTFHESYTNVGRIVKIQWPKFADFQGYASRETPPPIPHPRTKTKRREEYDPAAVAAATPKRARSDAPSDLTAEQKVALLAWVRAKHPALEPRIRELVDACLDFHRGKGNRHADWLATCRTWIRNADRFEPRSGARARQDERAQLMADNAREALRLAQEREQRERARIEGAGPDPDVRRLSAGRDAIAH